MKEICFIFLIARLIFSINTEMAGFSQTSSSKNYNSELQIYGDTLRKVDFQSYVKDPVYLDSLNQYIIQSIADSAFPGCAIAVGYQGKLIMQKAFGHQTYNPGSKEVKSNSIFDLASLTKVVATTTSFMILYERGKVSLNEQVQNLIPDFSGKNKDLVTIRHLLTHTSGLPAWKRLYLETSGKDNFFHEICITDLEYVPGTKTIYSDLGMILTQRIIETIAQQPLDQFFYENIAYPLEMRRTFFNPDRTLLPEIIPTEISPWHKKLVHGYVHDENSYAMGGIAGHAGLFSTAEDLAIFCQMYLNGGAYKHSRILQPETISLFTSRQNIEEGSTRALGWDTRSDLGSSSGKYMSNRAFGHTGFTGTSIWLDPVNHIFVVFLTNRVHPTRENQKIYHARTNVHDYIMKAILDISHFDQ